MSQSLVLNVTALQAENNLRRNLGTFSAHYGPSPSFFSHSAEVSAALTVASPLSSSSVLMVRTSGPVSVVLTKRDASTVSLTLKSLLVLEADIASIQFSAPASTIRVHIYQA